MRRTSTGGRRSCACIRGWCRWATMWICGGLRGRAAEGVVYGEVTTGAENDLERVTALARQMICLFGMNEKLGLAHSAQRQGGAYIHASDGAFQRDCSEKTAEEIDEEVKK